MATTQDLVNEVNGKFFGVTGSVPGENDYAQCTAVLHRWEQMLGLPIVYGHAFDMYANASPNQYDKELNGPANFPRAGAQIVFKPGYGGSAVGHVAVALEGCTPTKLRVIEQNNRTGGGDGRTRVWETNYNSVYGWFTPKGYNDNVAAPQGDIMNAEQVKDLYRQLLGREAEPGGLATWTGKPWAQVYYAIKDSAEGQAYTKAKAKQLQDLKDQIASQQAQIDKLNKQLQDMGSQPVTQDQAAAVVADVIKPAVGFWAKVWAWVKK